MKAVVFSGTTEGRRFSKKLAELTPVSIEELFVLMVKGENVQ